MKKALILLFVILFSGAALYAQEEYMELLRSDLKTQKVAIVTVAMELTDSQSNVFWPIYRKYDAELTTLNDEAIALIKDFAANYNAMTEVKADSLSKELFTLLGKRLKLQEKYYREFAKALDPILATKFMQIERRISALVDLQIGSEIPLIKK